MYPEGSEVFERVLFVIGSHTAGLPTRTVVGGIPHIPGKTILEKREYFRNRLDDIRTSLLMEPQGNKNMYGAVIARAHPRLICTRY
jgi:proline racemase/trans-L-3-hydroxyproline dehydratase